MPHPTHALVAGSTPRRGTGDGRERGSDSLSGREDLASSARNERPLLPMSPVTAWLWIGAVVAFVALIAISVAKQI